MYLLIPALDTRAPSQYPKRRLSVRSREVSKPRDLYLELFDRSEIWQALRQQCCRCACQIAMRYNNLKYRSRGFETLRDLTERRLFGYWDGALLLAATSSYDIWCLEIWYETTPYYIKSCNIISYCIISYDIISCRVLSCHITSYWISCYLTRCITSRLVSSVLILVQYQ